jgi:hypothetical protein
MNSSDHLQDSDQGFRVIVDSIPLAVASDELKQKFGGIEGLPTTLLYDRQGVLRKKVIGFEYTDAFETALTGLL